MDDMEELNYRMRISDLEARLELCDIRIAGLSEEIASPLTSSNKKEEASQQRERHQSEW